MDEQKHLANFKVRNTFIDFSHSVPAQQVRRCSSAPDLRQLELAEATDANEEKASASGNAWKKSVDLTLGHDLQQPPSLGAIGHPEFCRGPCSFFAQRTCRDAANCLSCHAEHSRCKQAKLDTGNRNELRRMDFGQRAGLTLPVLRSRAEKHNLPKVDLLLRCLQEHAAEVQRNHRTARLETALQKLSFRRVVELCFLRSDVRDELDDRQKSLAKLFDALLESQQGAHMATRGATEMGHAQAFEENLELDPSSGGGVKHF
mmetsp:Transcript_97129/g.172970  ORF Transcript_97129/g.172970 Transcript_97129/m.172970 type:complete len:260 (-) Transcript_97129:228-1007(-)|eukprot:CAMPEP_0197654466 /NCGR_PEP_ID=MMETSP1338-20131121/38866_1 /TAXON_ID=43686 ORGANISM="Pelagodinium beii, Strain RCC1491" /NCGR_SAMPLE_ID=MMETSP1338 /ASSEMBLY_ACC=CAM_ASM_000754 /LENGTH=259 /DNA_ID=CAMNT_0043229913 /DNA_START=46 /DNA_END=825 /DNA_ORIENTATION=+